MAVRPAQGHFAVICPGGMERRIPLDSWGYLGRSLGRRRARERFAKCGSERLGARVDGQPCWTRDLELVVLFPANPVTAGATHRPELPASVAELDLDELRV